MANPDVHPVQDDGAQRAGVEAAAVVLPVAAREPRAVAAQREVPQRQREAVAADALARLAAKHEEPVLPTAIEDRGVLAPANFPNFR